MRCAFLFKFLKNILKRVLNLVVKGKGLFMAKIVVKEESQVQVEQRKIIGVQIPISMYDALVAKSQEEWLSVSDIIRRLIREYLEEDK